MRGIRALIRDPAKPVYPFHQCGHRGRRPSMDQEAGSHQTLDLGLPASRTVKNVCVVYKPLSLWDFCYSSQDKLRPGPGEATSPYT